MVVKRVLLGIANARRAEELGKFARDRIGSKIAEKVVDASGKIDVEFGVEYRDGLVHLLRKALPDHGSDSR